MSTPTSSSGSPKAGWTQINFDNAGVEDHMMAGFKLKKGTTPAQLKKALLSQDDAAFGKIAAPGGDPSVSGLPALVGPGQKTTTLTELTAGTYGIACFVPAPDGSPHAAHGMFKVFTVSGKSNLKPPTDGVAEVTLSDTSITVPPGDAPKSLTVKVTNDGTTGTASSWSSWTTARRSTTRTPTSTPSSTRARRPRVMPPAMLVGGVQEVAPGGIGYVEWSLPAGNYGYVSTDGDDPPNDDFTKGLQGTFTIS